MSTQLVRTCVRWLLIGVALLVLILTPLAAMTLTVGPLQAMPSATDVVAGEPGYRVPTPPPGGGCGTNGFAWGG